MIGTPKSIGCYGQCYVLALFQVGSADEDSSSGRPPLRPTSTGSEAFMRATMGYQVSMSSRGHTRIDKRPHQLVEVWKSPVQISIPSLKDLALVSAPHPPARAFPISTIQPVDDIHARDDLADWSESLRIEFRVVAEIDVELSRPSVRTGHRIRDRTSSVALERRVILDCAVPPDCSNRGVAWNTELSYVSGSHPEKARIVKETGPDQVVKPVDTFWRPTSVRLKHEMPPGRLQLDLEDIGSTLAPIFVLGIQQERARILKLRTSQASVMTGAQ